ncbi:tripartite tricarboxylate transporter permease [Sodalis sp. RH22]|uniref:tripartite tricarboxylate transporter permease n=1 Tax=unclassified Sodalis (in: enterobacteria) TaxID=2636512 RepID=UPI0039B6A88D
MALLAHLMLGFSTALSWENLLYCFVGCTLGTLIGVLPGLGPVAAIAMLLPATYALPPEAALIMLAGIYYGAQYGGSTTAILLNIPGESASVVTTIDGHQMARQGRAGVALATSAIGSFFAGSVATLVLAAFAIPLTEVAFRFGPAEYFSLMFLGLIGAVVLSSGSLLKALAMIVLGLLLGLVGTDINSGAQRFTLDIPELSDGLSFVALAMGIFGFAEIIRNLEDNDGKAVNVSKISTLWPDKTDFKRMRPAIYRGTLLGSILGLLPGGGATLASFSAYALEKKISKYSAEFGHGAIEGVAGPEAANNAAAQTSFIPLLTLGIPSNAVMALMVGAMMIHDIQPGPQVMTNNPALFWGLLASMWIGNLMLVILNLPLVGLWASLLRIPYRYLYPAILVFCCIGVYSVQNAVFDVLQAVGFGLLGYVLLKLDCEPAPLLMGFVLGPLLEEYFRRALLLSHGDLSTFVTRPLSASLLAAAAGLILLVALPAIRRTRREAFRE